MNLAQQVKTEILLQFYMNIKWVCAQIFLGAISNILLLFCKVLAWWEALRK